MKLLEARPKIDQVREDKRGCGQTEESAVEMTDVVERLFSDLSLFKYRTWTDGRLTEEKEKNDSSAVF